MVQDLPGESRRPHGRVAAGDELALVEALDRTAGLVFSAAILPSGRRSTAENLTDALSVELWQAPEEFWPNASAAATIAAASTDDTL